MKVILVILLALPMLAMASCPNACSGHGSCEDHDQCVCYTNFQGTDCSQRICAYAWSFVTTPKGDLNHNGNNLDGTIYRTDRYIDASPSSDYLKTPHFAHGTWESWPSVFTENVDEGHFYMECANRGVCNRAEGICECFEGYEGIACSRTVCPNDCNGHGKCQTIADFASDSGIAYNLWDKDMSRQCKCDAGYEGPSCEDRVCPKGDDPLTKDHQLDDVQYVDVYINTCTGTTCTAAGPDAMGGSMKLKFTDHLGEQYVTEDIAVNHKSSIASTTVATNVKNALENLPNNAIPSVVVTEHYCEGALSTATTYQNGDYDNTMLRCPANAEDYIGFFDGTTETALLGSAGSTSIVQCHEILRSRCIRLKVKFTGNPGSQNLLEVDVSGVTHDSKTNAQNANTNIKSSVTKDLDLIGSSDTAGAYNYISSLMWDDHTQWSAKQLTLSDSSPESSAGSLPAGVKVKMECKAPGGSVYYDIGTFTIATTVARADLATVSTIDFVENIPTDSSCGDGTSDTSIKLTVVTEFIEVTHKLDTLTFFETGDALKVKKSGANVAIQNTVASVTGAVSDALKYVLLEDLTTNLATTDTDSDRYILTGGAGTKENNPCSDRGICDSVLGECTCFKGYSGDACASQNALSA